MSKKSKKLCVDLDLLSELITGLIGLALLLPVVVLLWKLASS